MSHFRRTIETAFSEEMLLPVLFGPYWDKISNFPAGPFKTRATITKQRLWLTTGSWKGSLSIQCYNVNVCMCGEGCVRHGGGLYTLSYERTQ